MFIVLTFGAPVMDAHGNSAENISTTDAFVFAFTVDVIWKRVGYFSMVNNSGTWTLPTSAMRPMSLRIISTIITFSARFLFDARSHSEMVLSSLVVRPRLTVPFIGRPVIISPSRSKNSSCEAEQTAQSPRSKNAAYLFCPRARWVNSLSGCSSKSAPRRMV